MSLEMSGGDVEIQVGPVKLTLRPSKPNVPPDGLEVLEAMKGAAGAKVTELRNLLDSLEADLVAWGDRGLHPAPPVMRPRMEMCLLRVRRLRALLREIGNDSG